MFLYLWNFLGIYFTSSKVSLQFRPLLEVIRVITSFFNMDPAFYLNPYVFDFIVHNETVIGKFYKEREEAARFALFILVQLVGPALALALIHIIVHTSRMTILLITVHEMRIIRLEHRKLFIVKVLACGIIIGTYCFKISRYFNSSTLASVFQIIIDYIFSNIGFI